MALSKGYAIPCKRSFVCIVGFRASIGCMPYTGSIYSSLLMLILLECMLLWYRVLEREVTHVSK